MNKVLSCFLCFWPLVLYFVIVILFGYFPLVLDVRGDQSWLYLLLLLISVFILVFVIDGVMLWLIVKIVMNTTLDITAKVIWGIVLLTVNVLAFPVYWFVFVRKE